MTFADVSEAIRATIATYTQALDDGRTDDVVATFCPDGVMDLPGMGRFEGREAIREAYAGWEPRRPQRHLVLNTLITSWDEHEATATSDLVFLLKASAAESGDAADEGWKVQLVGRYQDVLHHDDGTWRFHQRTAEFL